MDDKFLIFDVTDCMVLGGFGNLKGNLDLLKYDPEEIEEMIKKNNEAEDNIRLINSLLGSLKRLKERIDKAQDFIREESYLNDAEIDEVAKILEGDYEIDE